MNTLILALLVFGFRFCAVLLVLLVLAVGVPIAYMALRRSDGAGLARMGDME
jgi:uncharacterized membrane protein